MNGNYWPTAVRRWSKVPKVWWSRLQIMIWLVVLTCYLFTIQNLLISPSNSTTEPKNLDLFFVVFGHFIWSKQYFSVSTASLMLKNSNASSYVAFKIKTTAPKRYCVRPNSGLLAPDDIMDVKVMLQPGGTDEKHKFQVQTLIGENFTENLEANLSL